MEGFDLNGLWIAIVSALIGNIFSVILALISKSAKRSLGRAIAGLGICIVFLVGNSALCTIYSRDYGWKFSYRWLWTFLISVGYDLLILELLIWLIHWISTCGKSGGIIEKMRLLKVA